MSTTTTITTRSRSTSSSTPRKPGSTKSTLRPLYEQAKNAFLQRNLVLADKLVNQAFTQLGAPSSRGEQISEDGDVHQATVDPLNSQRRKWDILRITLQTTFYTSQPSEATLPPLKFLQRLRSQSLKLFTPVGALASVANVPDQVVLLLVVSSLKLEEVTAAKDWVEEWLVCRNPQREDTMDPQSTATSSDHSPPMTSYERIIDVYVLHVLPKLDLWDDAGEFLKYETEMREEVKERIAQNLQSQRKHFLNGTRTRTPSPTPSIASSASTIPASARQSPPRPASAASISSSASTATVRPSRTQAIPNGGSFSMTNMPKNGAPIGKADGTMLRSNGGAYLPHRPPTEGHSELPKHSNQTTLPPLPQPPIYQNHMSSGSSASSSSDGTVESVATPNLRGYLTTTIFPNQVRHIIINYYVLIADILNHHFGLALPTNFDLSTARSTGGHRLTAENIKLSIWHIFTLVVPLVVLFRFLSGRRRRSLPGTSGAGDKVRERLRRQHTNLALGPLLGTNFWKVAMSAVIDAVSMGGRGLV